MKIVLATALALLFLAGPAATRGSGHELYLLAGSMQDTDTGKPSYAWQLEFRNWLSEHFAFSLSYLNEGHVPYHHRDGGAVQAWTRVPLFDPRLSLGGGIGPYYYFDSTQPPSGMGYANEHGWGIAGSLGLTWYAERTAYQLRANLVETSGMDTSSILFGVGYQLDAPPWLAKGPGAVPPKGPKNRNEITVYAGRTIVNSFESEHALARSVEYRRRLTRSIEGSLAVLDEGKNDRIDRSGGAAQLWLVRDFLDDRLAVGVGGGGYYAADRARPVPDDDERAFLTGIASLTGSMLINEHWKLRVLWSRVHTRYHKDTDVILLGPGFLF